MNTDDPRHGTRYGYRDDRCRCDKCKRAIAYEHNVYKLRRQANGGRPLTVDKRGAVRRLHALMALGWPRRELARQAGYQGDAFALILNGKRRSLTLATHQRICDLYERLCMTSGPSMSTRIRAAAKGWAPPLAWDDIDDPNEQPGGIRTDEGDHRGDLLSDLLDRGCDLGDALRELDINREALRVWCSRNDHLDTYAALARRERRSA